MNFSTSRSSRIVACAALLLVVPALTGCSFEIVNSGGTVPETSQSSEADAGEQSGGLDRSAFDGRVSQTVSCESGSVDVSATGVVVEVEGNCDELEVTATGAVVLAGSVGSVMVNGTGNTVFIDTAQTIELAGTGNTVVWSEGTPDVSDSGVANTAVSSK